jgi:hypothetical protein
MVVLCHDALKRLEVFAFSLAVVATHRNASSSCVAAPWTCGDMSALYFFKNRFYFVNLI